MTSTSTIAPPSTRPRTIGYWATTGLTAFAFAGIGAAELARAPGLVTGMGRLGYPLYFVTLLGAWKLLGAAAIVAPRLPRLKEWAYAGIFFDLTGAALSHAVMKDPAARIAAPLIVAAVALASWALRPASRKLAPARTGSGDARPLREVGAAA
jgi:hypothetical protein